MPVVFLVVGSPPPYKVDDVFLPEVLLQHLDRLENHQKLLLPLNLLLGMQAVVAHSTVVLRIILSEIMQQHLPAADRRLGVGFRLLQQLPPDVLFGNRLPLHELLQFVQVLLGVEHDAEPLFSVAPGTAGLLIITFKALRNVIMDYETHIRFVDSHTEGNRCHNDIQFLHEEVVLCPGACLGVESGMIGCGLYVIGLQDGGQFFHFLARQAVDDTALASMLLDELDDLPVGIVVALLRPHLVVQVRTVEGTLELYAILNTQAAHDVRTHLVGSRRRKCDDRSNADRINGMAYLAVLRTEVMSPFRDAMRLVNGIEADFNRPQECNVLLLVQRLRSDIKQFRMPRDDIRTYLVDLGLLQGRVEIMRHTVLLADAVDDIHLILHQGDERRDDNRRALHDQ